MILNLGVSLYSYYFMVRVVLGDGSPSKITSYILKNNCTKFGTFVRFVPLSSKFTTKQLDYYTALANSYGVSVYDVYQFPRATAIF